MKTSVVAQLPLLTCTLSRTNCTQSQVDTCSIVQFYGKLKCAKEDGGARNDLIFSCREATYDSFYAKITSRPILAGFGLHLLTGSILTYRCHLSKRGVFPRGPSSTHASVNELLCKPNVRAERRCF